MVKVECPGHKQLKPFSFGVYQNGYYYLVDNVNDRLVKVGVESNTDAVIMACNEDNEYLFFDENLDMVNVEFTVKGSVDLPDTTDPYFPENRGGHHICTSQTLTGYYIVISSFQVASDRVGLEIFNEDLEVVNEHIMQYVNGVAWDHSNRILAMVSSGDGAVIYIFEHSAESKLNLLIADGIFGVDKRECLYLDGYLWIVDNITRTLEKRAINNLNPPLPTSLHTMILSNDSGGEESRLYEYQGNILVINRIRSSIDNSQFHIFESNTGAQLKNVSFPTKPPLVVATNGDYIYFVKDNGDLCQMNENLEVINTVYPNLIGLVALI